MVQVSKARDGKIVDSGCHALTASYVRARAQRDDTVEQCDFFEEFDLHGRESIIPSGCYNLDDLREYGQQKKWCPYFLARQAVGLWFLLIEKMFILLIMILSYCFSRNPTFPILDYGPKFYRGEDTNKTKSN